MSFLRQISLAESNPAGRVRTSNQRSQIGYLQSLAKDTIRFDEETNGAATSVYEGNGIGGVNMTVSAVDDFYMVGQSSKEQILENSRRLGSLIDGTPEEVYLCVTPVSPNAQALASINWKEFI